ncbi:hypothetical protein ACWEQ7_20270 [Streptomyces sp. NPDC004069]
MNAPTDAELIDSFGTGLQVTRLSLLPDGRVRWLVGPGRDHTGPHGHVPPGFAEIAGRASGPRLRFAVPLDAGDRHCVWETPGRRSIARALLHDDGDPADRIHGVLAELGSRLRVLHDQEPLAGLAGYPRPSVVSRLGDWLRSGRGPRAGAGFHYRLRRGLGPSRWEKLHDFAQVLLDERAPATTLHGWLSLGSIVPPDSPDDRQASVVLSGPEAARGRREIDLATVLGELEEFRRAVEGVGTERAHRLAAAFLTHYGEGWDRRTVAMGAVTRIATHAHDFACYVGWHDELHAYVPMLADLLDGDGFTALPDP